MDEKQRQSILRWRENNPERWRQIRNACTKRWRQKHPKAIRDYKNRYLATHRDQERARHRKYNRKLRQEILSAYGRQCAICGEKEEASLTLDHIKNDGRAHRLQKGRGIYADIHRQGFPSNKYRILCRRCNSREGRKSIRKKPKKTKCPFCGATFPTK